MELITLKKTTWALGLRWMPPVKQRWIGRSALPAFQIEFNTAARRTTMQGIQYGFGTVGKEIWSRYASATALCSCLCCPDSFLGLFKIQSSETTKELWWIYLQIDGLVSEYGDQVFSSEEEAASFATLLEKISGLTVERYNSVQESELWLKEHIHFSIFDKIIAKGHLSNLYSMASRSTIMRLTILSILMAIMLGTFFVYYHFTEKAALESAVLRKQEHAERMEDMQRHPERFFPMEWQQQPLASDAAAACLPGLLALPLASNGWELKSASCTGQKISIEWQYAEGATFTTLPSGAALDGKDMLTARSSIPVALHSSARPVNGPGTDHHALVDRKQATALLSDVTQASGARLSLPQFKAPKTRNIDKKTKITAPWHEGTWELSELPDILMDYRAGEKVGLFEFLTAIPGLCVESIKFDGKWAVKGKIYARH